MQTSIKMKYAGKAHEVSISTLGISGAKLSLFCMGCSLVLSLLKTPEQALTGCWTRSTGELKAQLAPSNPSAPIQAAHWERTGRTSTPGKIALWSLPLRLPVILTFLRKDCQLVSLPHFPCPSMESALDHGRPRKKEELRDLSPKLKQNPISLHAVSLTITMKLATTKPQIIPWNSCINKHNQWQSPGSGRYRSSSVFSLSHPHLGMPHSPFFSAGWSWTLTPWVVPKAAFLFCCRLYLLPVKLSLTLYWEPCLKMKVFPMLTTEIR